MKIRLARPSDVPALAHHRADAHAFYGRMGYECTGKRFVKRL